jgi:hypothetical protein
MRFDLRRSINPALVAGLLAWALAAVAFVTLRLVYDPPPARIHVRWAAAIDEPQRLVLEQRYGLTEGRAEKDGRTWQYYLSDLSRSNIRSLVGDGSVEDTHYIHREAFRIWRGAPRGAYSGPGAPLVPQTLEWLTWIALAGGALAFAVALIDRARPGGRQTSLLPHRLFAWFSGAVPEVSAEGVAAFRILFGLCLLGFFLARPVDGGWLYAHNAVRLEGLVGVGVSLLTRVPGLVDWLQPWVLFWTVLFIIGAAARWSFVMIVVGTFVWAIVYTSNASAHQVAVLPLTLVALLWSRWSDAWSVDARMGRAAPAPPGRLYGYTVWVPGFVLGITLAAAAFAKLRESGMAWVLNGTVRYHFLSDSPQAPLDWGLQLASHPTLAILLSFVAIAIELLVVVGVCSRRYSLRLAAGLAAASLLCGFWLFQGLVWPAWWIPLLSFLPWHLLRQRRQAVLETRREPRFSAGLRWAQVATIVLLVGQQVIVSAGRIELDPLLSTYDMYSTTYASPEDYEEKAGMGYWLIAQFEDGGTDTCQWDRSDFERFSSLASDDPAVRELVTRCLGWAAPVRAISVEGRRRRVDWRTWRLEGETRLPLAGPIVLKSAS